MDLKYKREIDLYFDSIKDLIKRNEYSYQKSLLMGVDLLINLKNYGFSKKKLFGYILQYYQNFCKRDSYENHEFDDFIVDFIAEIKGPPWGNYLDIWIDGLTYVEYKNYVKSRS